MNNVSEKIELEKKYNLGFELDIPEKYKSEKFTLISGGISPRIDQGIPLAAVLLPMALSQTYVKLKENGFNVDLSIYVIPDKEIQDKHAVKLYRDFFDKTKSLAPHVQFRLQSEMKYENIELSDNLCGTIEKAIGSKLINFCEELSCVMSFDNVIKIGPQPERKYDAFIQAYANGGKKLFFSGYLPKCYCLESGQEVIPFAQGKPTTQDSPQQVYDIVKLAIFKHKFLRASKGDNGKEAVAKLFSEEQEKLNQIYSKQGNSNPNIESQYLSQAFLEYPSLPADFNLDSYTEIFNNNTRCTDIAQALLIIAHDLR